MLLDEILYWLIYVFFACAALSVFFFVCAADERLRFDKMKAKMYFKVGISFFSFSLFIIATFVFLSERALP